MSKLALVKSELLLLLAVLSVGSYIAFFGHADVVTGIVDCNETAFHSHFRCEQ